MLWPVSTLQRGRGSHQLRLLRGRTGLVAPGMVLSIVLFAALYFSLAFWSIFQALAAIFPGCYASFNNTCLTVLCCSNTDEDAWGPVPGLLGCRAGIPEPLLTG